MAAEGERLFIDVCWKACFAEGLDIGICEADEADGGAFGAFDGKEAGALWDARPGESGDLVGWDFDGLTTA